MERTVGQTRVGEEVGALPLEAMIAGYQTTQVLYVMVKLGIPDQLAGSPRSAAAIAAAVGADPGACYRLLRALEFMGLVREPAPGTFSLTPMGERLTPGSSDVLREEILLTGDMFSRWWTGLEYSIRTGESSVPGIEGVSSFEYLHRNPEHTSRFNRLMSAMVGAMAKAAVAAYDFKPFRRVVDIGGGRGTLLSTILEAHPHLRGVVFDVPATAEEAKTFMSTAGHAARCECVGGDFFVEVPPGDCLILSAVLSDWNDERCKVILRNCRRSIAEDGRLLLLERLLEPDRPAPPSAFMDLHMLVIGAGTGRSEPEYRSLLAAAGLELIRVTPTGTPRSIFEARPA